MSQEVYVLVEWVNIHSHMLLLKAQEQFLEFLLLP